MRFHQEGYPSLILVLLIDAGLLYLAGSCKEIPWLSTLLITIAVFLLMMILLFFRNPTRQWTKDDAAIIAPADGKIVVVEKTYEPEYLQSDCWQISIFMSPIDVHVNRYPINGKIIYYKYHPGKKLVAWHPKSSTENERSTVVIEHTSGKKILVRQIAGLIARRIVCYAKEGKLSLQSEEMGFIKFGSRVDVFLPLESQVSVKINESVKGGVSIIGKL